MKKILAFALFLSTSLVFAQTADGIKFTDGAWMQAVKKAKTENKLIFMDAYTSWCGPCKMLQRNVFPDKNLGEFYNKNFVNVKFDMEKGEGLSLSEIYPLNAYPTMFFIDPNTGKVLMQVVGYREANDLLAMGKKAVDKKPKKQLGVK